MTTRKVEFDRRMIWITVDEVFEDTGGGLKSLGFVGYWSLSQPKLAYGESAKDSNGKTIVFPTEVAAQQAAERAAKANMPPA